MKLSKQSHEVTPILGDPGDGSQNDAIFSAAGILSGESRLRQALSPQNITSSGLALPGSPRVSDPENNSIFTRVLLRNFHF